MKLIKLWECDINKSFELHNSFKSDENGFENAAFGMDLEMYKQYVELKKAYSQGRNLRPGHVPDTKFVLVDDEGNYVGLFSLRHKLNDFLENGPGHIGYGIRDIYRKKGYASKGLKLVLQEAKKLGINEAYLSCNIDNEASLKVMLNNGGYIHHSDNEHHYVRIPNA